MNSPRKILLLTGLTCILFLAACAPAQEQLAAPTPSPTQMSTRAPTPTPSPTPQPVDCVGEDGTIHIYLYGTPESVDTSESSWIDGLRYYPDSGHLILETDGKEYVFANVSPEIWAEFSSAPSFGSYYNSHFKGNRDYWVTGYDGTNGDKILVHEMN